MNTGMNRDVLYFDKKIKNNNFLKTKLKTPLHTKQNQNRERPCLFLKRASLTVEASFCGTIFFLAIFTLLYLFHILYGYEKNILLLDNAVTEYECFGTKFSTGKGLLDGKVLMWDEEKKLCSIKERKKIPFIGSKMFSVFTYQQLCFDQYEGKSMIPHADGTEEEEEYVYLAENGTVYHKRSNCVYLNPKISQILYQEVEKKRNRSGGKYYSCKSCGKKRGNHVYVYITPYGDSWHTSKDCPGLKRTVRKVLRSEIGDIPACSKCGK